MLRGCPSSSEDLDRFLAIREAKAAELLFTDCLKILDMDETRIAMTQMFKGAATVVKRVSMAPKAYAAAVAADTVACETIPKTTTTAHVKQPVMRQTRLSSFLEDSMMMENLKKKEQAKKAKEKREAKKAQTQPPLPPPPPPST